MPSSQGWWLADVGLMSMSSTTIADTVQNCGVGKTCKVGCFDLQPELTLFTASSPCYRQLSRCFLQNHGAGGAGDSLQSQGPDTSQGSFDVWVAMQACA